MRHSPGPFEKLLDLFTARQAKKIVKMMDSIYNQISFQTYRFTGGKAEDFKFSDYPSLSRITDKLLATMRASITAEVISGIEWSWDLANTKNDDLVSYLAASLGRDIPQAALDRGGATRRNLKWLSGSDWEKDEVPPGSLAM